MAEREAPLNKTHKVATLRIKWACTPEWRGTSAACRSLAGQGWNSNPLAWDRRFKPEAPISCPEVEGLLKTKTCGPRECPPGSASTPWSEPSGGSVWMDAYVYCGSPRVKLKTWKQASLTLEASKHYCSLQSYLLATTRSCWPCKPAWAWAIHQMGTAGWRTLCIIHKLWVVTGLAGMSLKSIKMSWPKGGQNITHRPINGWEVRLTASGESMSKRLRSISSTCWILSQLRPDISSLSLMLTEIQTIFF